MTAKLRVTFAAALVIALGALHVTYAMPPDPEAKAPWRPVPLQGGPVFAMDLTTSKSGQPLLVAGGEEVFTASRADVWRSVAPKVGRVSSLVTAVGGNFFASAATTGIGYRTNNYGRSWSEARLRGTEPSRFLAASPNFAVDGVAFGITTSDWRLYRTDKGTTNWSEVVFTPGVSYQTGAVALSPVVRADETLLAGTDRGIVKSTDKGQTWELISTLANGAPVFGRNGGPPEVQGLVLPDDYGDDPDRSGDADVRTVFAHNKDGVFRSDDDGATWRRLPLAAEAVYGLAVSNGFPADPVLMAAVGGAGHVVAVSEDGGNTWHQQSGPDGVTGRAVVMESDFAVVARIIDPRTRFLYLPIALKAGLLNPGPILPPPPPSKGSRAAYLATDGDGVWRTRDAGRSWYRASAGLANVQPSSMAFLPGGGGNGKVLVGTRAAGLYRSLDGGRTYHEQPTSLPRGVGQEILALAVSPAFAADRTVYLGGTGGLWLSRDGGLGWQQLPALSAARWMALSPAFATDRTLIVDGQISTDGGTTFAPLAGSVEGPVAFSPDYATDRTLWAGGQRLRRSDDGGQTWTDFESQSLLRGRPVFAVGVIRVNLAEPARVFVGTDRGLVASHDNGVQWTRTNFSSQSIWSIAAQVTQAPQGAVVVAAGDGGLFWSTNRGIDWFKEPASPKPSTYAAAASDASAILGATPLRVSRYGHGNYRLDMPAAYTGR